MIIGDGIMLGSGGETASIFVTGLSETDNVTATHKIPTKIENPEWKSLPDGYTQLEYIESTGTQYIQVPAPTVTNGFIVEFSFYSGSQPSGYYPLFVSLGSNGFWLGWLNGSFIVRMADNKDVITTSFTTNKWIDAKVVYDGSTVKLFFDGNQVGSATATFANGGVNTYFCYDTANKTSFRLGEFEFSVGGTVNYHYVPCKNRSGSVGLYDLVAEMFYGNSGTGTFTAGAEIPQYIDGYVDGKTIIGKWTQIPNPAYVVPDGYTQLEYIDSTGTQYIDTGVLPNQNTNVELDCAYTGAASTTWYPLFGVHDANNQYYFSFVNTNSNGYSFGFSTQEYYPIGTYSSARRTLAIQNGSLVIDGAIVKTANPAMFTSVNSMYLFALNRKETVDSRITSMRCYSFKVEKDGSLVRHFIPSKRNSDGANGMYDLVTNAFFENAGTGTFTASTEIPQTIDGFLIDKIKDYGAWTVSNGDGTKAADVLIDAAAEFEVTL